MPENSTPAIAIKYLWSEIRGSFLGIFYDWYVTVPRIYWHKVFAAAKGFERVFALRLNFRLWISPLYQDYSVTGYAIGIIFRTFRIITAILFYILFFGISALVFVLWPFIPIMIGLLIIVHFGSILK